MSSVSGNRRSGIRAAREGERIRSIEPSALAVPAEHGDLHRCSLDRHEIKARRPAAARARRNRPRRPTPDAAAERGRAFLVVVAAQHHLCTPLLDLALRSIKPAHTHTILDTTPYAPFRHTIHTLC